MKKRWVAGVLAVAALMGALWYQAHRKAAPKPLVFQGIRGVEVLVFSPDGKFLAEDSTQGGVYLFDTKTGSQKQNLAVRTDRMVFSRDSLQLLTICRSTTLPYALVQTWDMATGMQIHRFVVPPGVSLANKSAVAAVSQDFQWAVIRGLRGALVYDISTGRLIAALPPPPAGFFNASFSSDGRWLALGSDAQAGGRRLYDTRTWQPIHALDGQATQVSGSRFSSDGSRLAQGDYSGITWWNTRTWKREGHYTMPSQYGSSRGRYHFSSDSRYLLVDGMDEKMTLHQVDCETGKEVMTVSGQMLQHASISGNRYATWVEVKPYQFLLYRDTYCLWDADQKRVIDQITIPAGPNASLASDWQIHATDLSDDGHLFAVGGYDDGIIRIWHIP